MSDLTAALADALDQALVEPSSDAERDAPAILRYFLSDPRTAAALESVLPQILLDTTCNTMADPDGDLAREWGREVAAAILAALPPDWCGHHAASEAMRALAEQTATIIDLNDRLFALREEVEGLPRHRDPDAAEWLYHAVLAAIDRRLEEKPYSIEQRFTATDAFPGALEGETPVRMIPPVEDER